MNKLIDAFREKVSDSLSAYLDNAILTYDGDKSKLIINVDNPFIKKYLLEKYTAEIETLLHSTIDKKSGFEIVIDKDLKAGEGIKKTKIRGREPETKSLVVYNSQIKGDAKVIVSMHLEKQKFGRKHPYQTSFDDLFDIDPIVKKEALKENINVIGTDYNPTQEKAIFTIQKILTVSGFYTKFTEDELNQMRHDDKLSCTIKVKPTQWYDFFGVNKAKSSRNKMEYNGHERQDAISALNDLANKKVLLVYKRHYYDDKNQERIDRIERKTSLISVDNLFESLSLNEDKTLDGGKTTTEIDKKRFITIRLDPIFIDQIKNYYLTKPANYKEEIKQLGHGKVSKYVYNFIDWILYQAEHKRRTKSDFVVRISREALAEALKMYAFINKRQWKRIDVSLQQGFDTALKLNYITELPSKEQNSMGTDLYVIKLNHEKFSDDGKNSKSPE